MLNCKNYDVAAVIVLANGERGDFEKGSEDLIEHIQHIKAKLLIQNMLAYRNIYTDLHRIDSKVDTLSTASTEVNGMKDEVNGMKDEMNCMNQLLHKIAMKIQV